MEYCSEPNCEECASCCHKELTEEEFLEIHHNDEG